MTTLALLMLVIISARILFAAFQRFRHVRADYMYHKNWIEKNFGQPSNEIASEYRMQAALLCGCAILFLFSLLTYLTHISHA